MLSHMDGQIMVSQETKDHIIAQLEEMFALEELLWMLIWKHACMLELKSQELMLKSCQVNGNSKLDHALELKKEIIYGWQDIFFKELQKNLDLQ